jgi:hypothetical protein
MSFYELAVLGKSTFAISPICENHTVFLQPIQITIADFKKLLFKDNSFCVSNAYSTVELITFASQFISMATTGYYPTPVQPLDLYECIFQYALYDLNLSVSSISPIAQVELRNELAYLTLTSLDIISSAKYTTIESSVESGNTFTVSVVFSNKNPCIKPVIIKFPYLISGTTPYPPVPETTTTTTTILFQSGVPTTTSTSSTTTTTTTNVEV